MRMRKVTQRSLLGHATNQLRANCCAIAIAVVTQRTCPRTGTHSGSYPMHLSSIMLNAAGSGRQRCP
eukprot:4397236-Alexandrium_andersonii.AAC.1